MIIDVFTVHILLSEIAALVFENLAIHGSNLNLLIKLISSVAVNKDSFTSSMGM